MKLRRYRIQNGLSMAQMAEKIGCSIPSLCRYEIGKTFPTRKRIKDIVAATEGNVTEKDFDEPESN